MEIGGIKNVVVISFNKKNCFFLSIFISHTQTHSERVEGKAYTLLTHTHHRFSDGLIESMISRKILGKIVEQQLTTNQQNNIEGKERAKLSH